MSVDHNLYLGYYFDIKPIKRNHIIVYNGCPKCEKPLKTDFCPTCGTQQVKGLERIRTHTLNAYEICEELGEDWNEYIVGTDSITGKNDNIAILNEHSDLDTYSYFSIDIFNYVIPEMTSLTKEFITLFKNRYGEDSIKIHYGFVNWYN